MGDGEGCGVGGTSGLSVGDGGGAPPVGRGVRSRSCILGMVIEPREG